MEYPTKKILFVCAENAGRSQMAEAFFNFYAKDTDFSAESSGTIPAERVNPAVVEAMKEKDINIHNAKPKKFDLEAVGQYERIISFGRLVKAAFPQAVQEKIEEWLTDDPSDKPIKEVRKIRDEVEARVKNLMEGLKSGLESER